jgi:hypothetical protein
LNQARPLESSKAARSFKDDGTDFMNCGKTLYKLREIDFARIQGYWHACPALQFMRSGTGRSDWPRPPLADNSTGQLFGMCFEEFYRVADRHNGYGCVASELVFEHRRKLDRIEAIGPEIVEEVCGFRHPAGLNIEMLRDNHFNAFANVAHTPPFATQTKTTVAVGQATLPARYLASPIAFGEPMIVNWT